MHWPEVKLQSVRDIRVYETGGTLGGAWGVAGSLLFKRSCIFPIQILQAVCDKPKGTAHA